MKILLFALLGLVALLAIPIAGFLAYRAYRQRANAETLAIRSSNGILEATYLRLGGIDQWVSIRGEDRNNPVVLVLHGGPATSYLSFTKIFQPWERHFTVVQWDRRGVGKTFGRNRRAGSGEMSLDRIAQDGIELAEILRMRLNQKRVILLGHSMGSMIGIAMAARRPDQFYAYVGTEQVITMARNEEVSYRMISERLLAAGDEKPVAVLRRLGPPPYSSFRDWGAKQRLAERADAAYGRLARDIPRMLLFSPAYSLLDLVDFVGGQQFCCSKLYQQWMAFDALQLGTRFETPILIIQGEGDVMTPTNLAQEWLGAIDAPHKELVSIEGGGHLVMATAPDAYLAELLARVLPLVRDARVPTQAGASGLSTPVELDRPGAPG